MGRSGGGEPNKISERRLEILIKTLATLDQNDVDYIIVFPPLAPTVYKHIEKKRPDFMKFMKSVVSRVNAVSNAAVYDLHNPNTIQTTNCEFLDGIHGGQTTYARILLNVKDSTIGQYLNQSKIRDDIYKFAGRTMIQMKLNVS